MSRSVGDQHRPNGITANPFEEEEQEEKKVHISEYTAQEIAILQSRLDKQLGPEYISSRAGPGGQKVHYLAAEKVIGLANEIFGFNGWSSSIQNIQIDFVDENATNGKVSLGLSVTVRVTLRDGTYHEDIGYGSIQNASGKAAAFEKAKKEGTTDGLKRALRTFGNVLGNCIYDKEYVKKVSKVKVGAARWDPNDLHRHVEYVPKRDPEDKMHVKQEMLGDRQAEKNETNMSVGEDFELADFDDAEFDEHDFGKPDEVVLPAEPPAAAKRLPADQGPAVRPPIPRHMTTPSRMPPQGPINPRMAPQRHVPTTPGISQQHHQIQPGHPSSNNNEQSSSPGIASQHFGAPPQANVAPQAGFFSARAAEHIDELNKVVGGPNEAPRFNIHAETPSIRKTSGIDHSKSGRLLKNLVPDPKPADTAKPVEEIQRDFTNPQTDPTRKVGMPNVSGQSPMHRGNSSAYRPPTRRTMDPSAATTTTVGHTSGGVDRVLQATNVRRAPLNDVSNVQHAVTATTHDGFDAKRQRVSGPENPTSKPDENSGPVGGVG